MAPQSDSSEIVPASQPNTARAVVSMGPHVFHEILDMAAITEYNVSIYHRYLEKINLIDWMIT